MQAHTRGTFIPSSAFSVCYFEAKQGDRPKFVVETQESKPKGAVYFHLLLLLLLLSACTSFLA